MELFRWSSDPFAGLGQLRSEMQDVFGRFNRLVSPRQLFPPVNVFQDEDGLTLVAELPGVQSTDISIDVEGGRVRLEVERKAAEGVRDEQYHRRDRRTGSFSRELELPAGLDNEKIEASLSDGILRIYLPKAEAAKPRTIEVKPG